MSRITNDGLTRPVWHRMLYSCTRQWSTVSVKGLNDIDDDDAVIGCQDGGRVLMRRTTGRLDLEFKPLRPADSGNYSCTSWNKAGSHSAVGTVTVNCTSLQPPHWPMTY